MRSEDQCRAVPGPTVRVRLERRGMPRTAIRSLSRNACHGDNPNVIEDGTLLYALRDTAGRAA